MLLLFMMLMPGRALAQTTTYAPIVFWNVPNYYSYGWENIRYPDPETAFRSEWEKNTLQQCGSSVQYPKEEIFVDVYPIGNPPGDYYNAHEIFRACGSGSTAISAYYSTARRWASCTNTGPFYYSPVGLNCTAIEPDPELNRGNPCVPDCTYGDPINAANGNKFEQREEYLGPGAFPLRFGWTYNSNGTPIAASPYELSLGRNRLHSYAMAVHQSSNGTITTAYVSRPDGNTYRFNLDGGTWVSMAGGNGRLSTVLDPQGAPSGWRFTGRDGIVELYGANGRLVALTGLNGLSHKLAYDSKGRLAEVADSANRKLTFLYGNTGPLTELLLPDGGKLKFAYDASSNLSTVTYPDNTTVQYRYNESGLSASGTAVGALTGVLDEAQQRYSTTTYDGYTYATSTYLANGIDRYDITYTKSQSGYATQTTVVDSNGRQRTVTFLPHGGRVRPTSRWDTCSGCATGQISYTYDASGQPDVTTDINAVATDYNYDAAGFLLQKTEASNESTNGQP